MFTRRLFPTLAAILLVLPACHADSTEPDGARVEGIYLLKSVSGNGAVTGSMTLLEGGTAERRVRYRKSNNELTREYLSRGTFQLRANATIDLEMRDDDGRSLYAWRTRGQLSGGVLQLRFGDPADGPDIIETFQRR